MFIIMLILHILVASIMTLTLISVFVAAYKRRETAAYVPMLISFIATISSGLGLLFVAPTGLGRLCVMMSAFTILVLVARTYYRKQVIVTQSIRAI